MRRIFIIVAVVFLLGVLLFLFDFFSPRTTKPPTIIEQQPTSTPFLGTIPTILSTSPINDPTKQFLPIQQIAITLSAPITPTKVFITTTPVTTTSIRQGEDNSTIIISADPAWKEGITKISVYVSGNTEPFIYNLNTGFPKTPDPDSDY